MTHHCRFSLLVLIVTVAASASLGCQAQTANPIQITEHEILVDERNYSTEVATASTPVLLDFSASWCPPCQRMAPIVQRLAADYGDQLLVGIVDVDRNESQSLAQQFKASAIPTFVILRDGELVASNAGYLPEPEFRAWVAKHTRLPAK